MFGFVQFVWRLCIGANDEHAQVSAAVGCAVVIVHLFHIHIFPVHGVEIQQGAFAYSRLVLCIDGRKILLWIHP